MRFELRPTDDGSLTVFDREAGECFKSRHAARLESEHVFYRPAVLENPAYGRAEGLAVLELGFGLGTNFLHFRDRGFRGDFRSVERDLGGARFYLGHEPSPALAEILSRGEVRAGAFTARLLQGDFFETLAGLGADGYRADAVLFDPFSPKANPDAWTERLFGLCFGLLRPGGRLVTYSVSRAAKDAARASGFAVEKRDLPPELRKRSALLAIRPKAE
jgi:tRNA U34 5-methylaminomethyl-2-thiouridine-forming methyltransferase MnmC